MWVYDSPSPGVRGFSEGLAVVSGEKGRLGHIDRSGTVVIAPRYDAAMPFSEGLATVSTWGGRTLYVNKSGEPVIEGDHLGAGPFSDGRALFMKGGKCGFIDRKGEVVIKPQFTVASSFRCGRARVEVKGRYGFIDKNGHMVIPATYDYAYDFSENLAKVVLKDKCGFVDRTGKVVIPITRSSLALPAGDGFSDGLCGLKQDAWIVYVNRKGRVVCKTSGPLAWPFFGGLALVSFDGGVKGLGGTYGYIDKRGRLAIRTRFSNAYPFTEGLAAVRENDKWGYIDTSGFYVIPPKFEDARPFFDGAAWVWFPDHSCGYIDRTGEPIWTTRQERERRPTTTPAFGGTARSRSSHPSGKDLLCSAAHQRLAARGVVSRWPAVLQAPEDQPHLRLRIRGRGACAVSFRQSPVSSATVSDPALPSDYGPSGEEDQEERGMLPRWTGRGWRHEGAYAAACGGLAIALSGGPLHLRSETSTRPARDAPSPERGGRELAGQDVFVATEVVADEGGGTLVIGLGFLDGLEEGEQVVVMPRGHVDGSKGATVMTVVRVSGRRAWVRSNHKAHAALLAPGVRLDLKSEKERSNRSWTGDIVRTGTDDFLVRLGGSGRPLLHSRLSVRLGRESVGTAYVSQIWNQEALDAKPGGLYAIIILEPSSSVCLPRDGQAIVLWGKTRDSRTFPARMLRLAAKRNIGTYQRAIETLNHGAGPDVLIAAIVRLYEEHTLTTEVLPALLTAARNRGGMLRTKQLHGKMSRWGDVSATRRPGEIVSARREALNALRRFTDGRERDLEEWRLWYTRHKDRLRWDSERARFVLKPPAQSQE